MLRPRGDQEKALCLLTYGWYLGEGADLEAQGGQEGSAGETWQMDQHDVAQR